MARFHVYASVEGGGYLLDVQANLLSHLSTRVVVPLLPLEGGPKPARVLNPEFQVRGNATLMATQFLATVPQRLLGEEVGNLESQAHLIFAALDCLFQGI